MAWDPLYVQLTTRIASTMQQSMPIGFEELDSTGERNCDFDNDLHMDHALLVMAQSIMACIYLASSCQTQPV